MEARDLLMSLADQVRVLAQSETVIGESITIGGTTIIPVTRVTFGFGAGGGSGDAVQSDKAGPATGSGGGGGAGVRMEPAAFIVMKDGELSVLAAPGKRGALGTLFEQVPDLVERISASMQAKKVAGADS